MIQQNVWKFYPDEMEAIDTWTKRIPFLSLNDFGDFGMPWSLGFAQQFAAVRKLSNLQKLHSWITPQR